MLAALFLLAGCKQDLLLEQENFKRLFKAPQDIEAVDFLAKPAGDGYLILGNSIKVEEGTPISNLILFDVDAAGFTISAVEISTSFTDEGRKLYLAENNTVFILGQRVKNGQIISIVASADLQANVRSENDTATVRELIYENEDVSLIFQDLLLEGENMVFSGFLQNSVNRTNKITQVFNRSELFSLNLDLLPINQLPIKNEINFDNSKHKSLRINEASGNIFIIGQEEFLGGQNPSINISIDILKNSTSIKPLISPNLNSAGNQFITSTILGNNQGELFFGGNLGSDGATDPDSLFVIKSIFFEGSGNDQSDIRTQSTNYITAYGDKLVDILQLSNGDIVVVTSGTRASANIETNRASYLLKFSFFVDSPPVEQLIISYSGNGSYDIKKIIEEDDKLVILSRIEFGTGETAIELSKINF